MLVYSLVSCCVDFLGSMITTSGRTGVFRLLDYWATDVTFLVKTSLHMFGKKLLRE